MRLGTGVDARCICARVQARRPRHGARRAAPGAAPQPGGTSSRPSRTIYTTLCACSSAVALWHCRARCLAPSCYLPHEETKRAHQGESSRVMQQRRAGMQVQGCDARPGACGRAHQGRRWCGRRRRNRRFVHRPLVAHPLAPPRSSSRPRPTYGTCHERASKDRRLRGEVIHHTHPGRCMIPAATERKWTGAAQQVP